MVTGGLGVLGPMVLQSMSNSVLGYGTDYPGTRGYE
jgi:hypothetical protein